MTSLIFGFIENSTTFYYLFLAPIMIAYERRATQEITPAATIITINVVVVSLLDYILSEVVVLIVDAAFRSDSLRRIPVILALIIALWILKEKARKEFYSVLPGTIMDEFEDVQNLVVTEQSNFVSILSPKQSERISLFSPEDGGFLGSPVLEDIDA